MVMLFPQAFTGMSMGAWTVLPERMPGEPCVYPSAVAPFLLSLPTARCLPVPGPRSTADGSWALWFDARLPDAGAAEPCRLEVALPESLPEPLPQAFPAAGLSSPTTLTELPHALTGTWTGISIEFPDSTPGEFDASPVAPASACA